MANRLPIASCLSAEPHEESITNPLIHFLGCIEICERDSFLKRGVSIRKDELVHQPTPHCEKTNEVVEDMKSRWRSNVESEMRRIALLRRTLSKDSHDKRLVEEVENSGSLWRDSTEYTENIDKVRQWRGDGRISITGPDFACAKEDYIPEEDTSVPIIQFKDCREFSKTRDNRLSGKFPNQKTTITMLLDEAKPMENLLYKDNDFDCDRIKYFHIPSNNMIWAEEAIARYYGEKRPDFSKMQRRFQRPQKTCTYMVLQDRYWRGQLHGDASSPPHARYMSPMCETISSSVEKLDRQSKNIVLFIPYLHWETSKRRQQFAREIDKIVLKTAKDLDKEEVDAKKERQKKRSSLPFSTISKIQKQTYHAQRHESQLEDFAEVVEAKMNGKAFGFESMATYRDRMLLRDYLSREPPIHPRRTLDQAYYWTLKSTKKRDKDQVIYRGTTATRDAFHHYDADNENWPEHEGLKGRDCGTCRTNVRKVSRVIMVDQLWMWVLDGKTLITCFPKRYGANKQDYSGVHKSIRTSLENIGSNQIRTVFELALIVLDECTMTLFDRTKSLDRRPQVIDEFSKAIGKITHKQTVAFTRLWRWTDEARKIFRSQGYMNTRGLHIPLLDINPEGKLEREIEDIIEELDIMLRISNIHQDIIKSFIEQAENILDPGGDFRKRFERNNPVRAGANKKKYENYQSFKLRANECQDRVVSHVKDLESLRKTAKNTADDVLHLLTMKQQQASVVQAWQAVKQSDETIKQGRSIMVFTLATIVFLPLSFLTSVFGMNNYEFGNNNWSLRQQLKYIFLISAGVVLVSLLFAFSAWIRAWIWSLYSRVSIKFATRTGIYTYISQRKQIEEIFDETYFEVHGLKNEAKRQALAEKIEKRKEAMENELQYIRQIFCETHRSEEDRNPPDVENSLSSSISTLRGNLSLMERLSGLRRKKHGDGDMVADDDPEIGAQSVLTTGPERSTTYVGKYEAAREKV
ncbi:hypothetical protein F4782DRAFT_550101 [Xylaria castorea]|nr:hypothetical protein F4782DRAFT_550101 [Xylaria castorea]